MLCQSRTYALIKLPVAPTGHGWVVTAIDLSNMVALDVGDLVHGQITCKGHLRRRGGEGKRGCIEGGGL